MITTVVIVDAAVDVASPASSRATVVAALELLFEHYAQLH
jgi:hypothetical protein